MYSRSRFRLALAGLPLAWALAVPAVTRAGEVARRADGHPDLNGVYDTATLTPLQRDPKYGDKLFLTREEAAEIAQQEAEYIASRDAASDPEREAPPEGGDGSVGAAGNVGGYNAFWIDRGTENFEIDGKVRTSILVDPPDGRMPEVLPEVRERRRATRGAFRQNTGEAWWLHSDGPGPYDNPEQRPFGERCLLGFGSTGGPPMLPVLYNNHKRIVQTDDHVMIQVEMIHDARIVRLGGEHPPADVRKWLGDSIGWWEGDTLVVDTTNFRSRTALRGADENLHVVERFTPHGVGLVYRFTVEDPTVWTAPWTGEYIWPATDEKVYEYACHEGNYALGNILRGARLLEADALGTGSTGN